MYVPEHFRVNDLSEIKQFILQNSFSLIASVDNGVPIASHLLTDLQEDDHNNLVISAHMARNNPLWKSFDPDTEILSVFQGAHSYISPTWYNVQAVPTWNYMTVHAYGHPKIIDDRSELYDLLDRLVERHERANVPGSKYRLEELPQELIGSMMNAIVGFKITVTRLEASFKLSQNRSEDDHRSIIVELKEREDDNSQGVARAMEQGRLPARKGSRHRAPGGG